MIVPDDADRFHAPQFEQIGIGVIGLVALIIVAERDQLVIRLDGAPWHSLGRARIGAALDLVDVVADMQHEIDVVAACSMAVGVEIAVAEIGAGEERDLERFAAARRRRARQAGERGAGAREEAVEVTPARAQAAHVNLGAIIVRRRSLRFAACGDARERFVLGDLPGDAAIAADKARPQDDAVRERIAGGDAVREQALRKRLRPGWPRQRGSE